tara:strand:+ start:288 stop:479 length:192 start_codon:yes stop_codon:yes gene_type:complete
MKILAAGTSGLIGREVMTYFAVEDHQIHGLDNNMQAIFFDPKSNTRLNQIKLESELSNFTAMN